MALHPLSAAELLDAASICRDRPETEVAVYLSALRASGRSFDECARLAVGERDAVLARLHAAMFGHDLDLAAACPDCGTRLDVNLTTDALLVDSPADPAPSIEIDGRPFGVRPIDSTDLAEAAVIGDASIARALLARRCLIPIGEGAVPALSEAEVGLVAAALAAIDPASDLYVPLACFECDMAWDAPVDMARILATAIEAAADALMDDIHDIALAYHWSEDAILALTPARRRAYLERLRG